MKTFFTSDLHFGHQNIIRYCDRPYASVEEMNSSLVELWNGVVSPEDEVWVLGDVCMGKIDDSLRRVGELNGVKYLVVGNHDRMFDSKEAAMWRGRYYEAGFTEIIEGEKSVFVGEREVTLCHFPYAGDSWGEDRFVGRRPEDRGGFLLHGHVHDRWRQRGRMINVGVDAWAGKPARAETIAELVRAGERELDCLVWTQDSTHRRFESVQEL